MTLPYEIDDLLSAIVFGTTRSPGVVAISGHERAKKWDVQSAKGSTGATTKLNGDDPAQFTCTFSLAGDGDDEVDDFAQWDRFQKLIESTTNGAKPFALPIYHPDLARQRITEATCASVGPLTHDGRGGATVVVKFLEFKPPKIKPTAKASARSAAGGGGGANGSATAPDPNAAAKAELAGLLARAKQP